MPITNSSVVGLLANLATKGPATRSRKLAAGGKVDAQVSVRSNRPKCLVLVGERTDNIQLWKVGAWVWNRNRHFDLGSTSTASSPRFPSG